MTCSSDFFDEDGAAARGLRGYEVRPQQVQMAEAVEDALTGSKHLIVEAGTGVGKSLAYLVPLVDWAVRENRKVVISTYTKALQNQLFVKDLPFLKSVMDIEFRYAVCMGSENYVCLRKANKSSIPESFRILKQKKQSAKILEWLSGTSSGLVTDMEFVPDRPVWSRFSRESDLCLGRKCPHAEKCFYRAARSAQLESHVLVTNHSLLFSDMMSEAQVLPDFHALVLDEAHTLEDVATTHFGREAGNARLDRLLADITDITALYGYHENAAAIQKIIETVYSEARSFFAKAGEIFGTEDLVTPFEKEVFPHENICALMTEMSLLLLELAGVIGDPEKAEEVKANASRCDGYAESLEFIFGNDYGKYVYWLVIKKRKTGIYYSFHAAPIDISEQMRTCLFDPVCPVVLTSATLSSYGPAGVADFSFIKNRLGLNDCLELLLDSPFDHAGRVLMYLPRGIADPNKDFAAFTRQVRENIVKVYDVMGGRIFALFTSYAMLNAVADGIVRDREDINILKQGDLPRYVLLDVFKKNKDSLLLGTTTFWQGVDVPGDSLECVIITKLPFSVPTDPINAARIKFIQEDGRNPFGEYQLPRAIIMFKQGFGRLIRSHSDRGVVAVLDPRIHTRFYGQQFINALPECRRTEDITEVDSFFRSE